MLNNLFLNLYKIHNNSFISLPPPTHPVAHLVVITGCIEEEGGKLVQITGTRMSGREPGARVCCMCFDFLVGPLGRGKVKVKVKFILEQATKAQRGSRGIVLLFL